jgi:predicted PurR-regulated permease PerM
MSTPDVDRLSSPAWLRFFGFNRWIMVLISLGAAVGFLVWLGVTATNDFQLSHHGVVVTATVKNTAPYGEDTQYLLRFVVDGQSETRWSTHVARGSKVGDSVSVIVDRTDHANFEPTAAYGRRWLGYVFQLLFSLLFAALGVMFLRMDAAGFRTFLRFRYGFGRRGISA